MAEPTSDAANAKLLVRENAEASRLLYGPLNSAMISFPPREPHAETDDVHLRSRFESSFRAPITKYAKLQKHVASNARKRPRSPSDVDAGGTDGGNKVDVPSLVIDGVDLDREESMSGIPAQGSAVGDNRLVVVPTNQRSTAGAVPAVATATALQLARDRPKWHAPWENFRVIMGHVGWVRSVAVEPGNMWFATGSADRTIKIWDLASGKLKLTLTGHISAVRGIAVSDRHPYMFSVGEDKMVKCWDLEHNKVTRHYHGHLSGVYTVALHPTLDLLMTAGRDAVVRVWDMRSKRQVFALQGHRDTVNTVFAQGVDPQVVSCSVDSTVRLWDLAAGKCMATLTNHKKGVRGLARHPTEFSFASASADNIKTWCFPRGDFMRNLSGHTGLVNALAVNQDGVLCSGGDNGNIRFWDYASAHCFQSTQVKVQPGSMDNEAGIFAMAFDHSGSRLITCEADKTIKMWREVPTATEQSHPLVWAPDLSAKRY